MAHSTLEIPAPTFFFHILITFQHSEPHRSTLLMSAVSVSSPQSSLLHDRRMVPPATRGFPVSVPVESNDTNQYSMLDNPFHVHQNGRPANDSQPTPTKRNSPIDVIRNLIRDNSRRETRKRKTSSLKHSHSDEPTIDADAYASPANSDNSTTSSFRTTSSITQSLMYPSSEDNTPATSSSIDIKPLPLFLEPDEVKQTDVVPSSNAVEEKGIQHPESPDEHLEEGEVRKIVEDKDLIIKRFIDNAKKSGIEVKDTNGELVTDNLDPRKRSLRPGLNFVFPAKGNTIVAPSAAPSVTPPPLMTRPTLLERLQGPPAKPSITAVHAAGAPLRTSSSSPSQRTFQVSTVEMLPSIHTFLESGYPSQPPPNQPPEHPIFANPYKPQPFESNPMPPAVFVTAPNMVPSHQNITFAPRTIVSPPPRQGRRQSPKQQPSPNKEPSPRYSPPSLKGEAPFASRGWTRDLNDLERDVLGKHVHLLNLQREFDQRRRLWDRSRNRDHDSIAKLRADVEASQRLVEADRVLAKDDREHLRELTRQSAEQIAEANNRLDKQVDSLSQLAGNLHHLADRFDMGPFTPSAALGSVIRQLTFIIEEQSIQTTPAQAFTLYRVIAPALKFLLITLRKHTYLEKIPHISPPPSDLQRFSKLVRRLRAQLTDDQIDDAPGPAMEFETGSFYHTTARPQLQRKTSDVSMRSTNSRSSRVSESRSRSSDHDSHTHEPIADN
jgi:hypothetical protein